MARKTAFDSIKDDKTSFMKNFAPNVPQITGTEPAIALATFGIQFRALRIHRGTGQKDLASLAGVAVATVKAIESGKGASLVSIVRLLVALDAGDWVSTLATSQLVPDQLVSGTVKRRQRFRANTNSPASTAEQTRSNDGN